MKIIFFLQKLSIDEKIKQAPDNGYLIGAWIGSLIPFVILVGIAYWMYYRAKNKKDNE